MIVFADNVAKPEFISVEIYWVNVEAKLEMSLVWRRNEPMGSLAGDDYINVVLPTFTY